MQSRTDNRSPRSLLDIGLVGVAVWSALSLLVRSLQLAPLWPFFPGQESLWNIGPLRTNRFTRFLNLELFGWVSPLSALVLAMGCVSILTLKDGARRGSNRVAVLGFAVLVLAANKRIFFPDSFYVGRSGFYYMSGFGDRLRLVGDGLLAAAVVAVLLGHRQSKALAGSRATVPTGTIGHPLSLTAGSDYQGAPAPATDSQSIHAMKGTNDMALEYKVMTQKDRFFSGKFNPEKLEAALNSYAAEGWRVVGMATGEIGSGFGSREELIFVLERNR